VSAVPKKVVAKNKADTKPAASRMTPQSASGKRRGRRGERDMVRDVVKTWCEQQLEQGLKGERISARAAAGKAFLGLDGKPKAKSTTTVSRHAGDLIAHYAEQQATVFSGKGTRREREAASLRQKLGEARKQIAALQLRLQLVEGNAKRMAWNPEELFKPVRLHGAAKDAVLPRSRDEDDE
jgi:hypothetical protein